ncbi:hypothetical protein QCA50_008391 [Cerrena zonata]|uniref:Fungal-type protein kinase domain-containing protein n=1 Tax=Cerrena zonata TaxID=2478898 RepID=A0AAW0GEK0_9APHY
MGADPIPKSFSINTLTHDMFFDEFLPANMGGPQRPKLNFWSISNAMEDPNAHCSFILDRIRRACVCPGYQIVDTSRPNSCPLKKETHSRLLLYPVGSDFWKSPSDAWRALEVQIHIDVNSENDPFTPGPANEERKKKLIHHLANQMTRQQRTHIFSVVIFGHYARFLRWDRAGCIVTIAVDLMRWPLAMANFLWRYSRLCSAARGFDPTATDATFREASTLKRTVRHFIQNSSRNTDHLRPSLTDDDYPVYRIEVTALDGTKLKLIIGKPIHAYTHAAGRATRVYLAYLTSERRLVILKDLWSADNRIYMPEGKMYKHLLRHNVPHLPKVLAAGGVEVEDELQVTRTQGYSHFRGYTRQRIVQEIYFPLSTVNSSKELTQVFRDAVEALYVAYNTAHVLHQDISIGNIMVTQDGRGILNDWDCAWKRTARNPEQARRVGTWKFMSMRITDNPYKPHEIQDDLESCFWSMLWTTIHHIKASKGWRWPRWETFDDCTVKNFVDHELADPGESGGREIDIGGEMKRRFLQEQFRNSRFPNIRKLKWRCEPFNTLLHDLAQAFDHIWYLADGFRQKDFDPESFSMRDIMEVANMQHASLLEPSNILGIFDAALAKDNWLEDDAVPNMFPIKGDSEWDRYEAKFVAHYKEKDAEKARERVERRKQRLAEKAAKEGTQSTDVSANATSEAREPSPCVTDYPPSFRSEAKKPKVKALRRSTRIKKPPSGDVQPKQIARGKRKRKEDEDAAAQPAQISKRIKVESSLTELPSEYQ